MVSKRSGNDILLAYINLKKCQICYHDRSAILNLNLVIFCILILFSHSPAFYISLNLVNLVFLVLVSNFLKLCLKHVSTRTLCLLSNHMCVFRLPQEGGEGGDKLSHSRLFQMAKFQNLLQPWRRNGIYFCDKLSHSRLFQMIKFQNFLQPNGMYL